VKRGGADFGVDEWCCLMTGVLLGVLDECFLPLLVGTWTGARGMCGVTLPLALVEAAVTCFIAAASAAAEGFGGAGAEEPSFNRRRLDV